MSGEMVMPDMEVVNGARETSERCRECVPVPALLPLPAVDGEFSGEYASSPFSGVMPNADAAREPGRDRRKLEEPCTEFARVSGVGRRGEGLVPWKESWRVRVRGEGREKRVALPDDGDNIPGSTARPRVCGED